jgi:hypothetical protein
MFVQENYGIEGLILGAGCDFTVSCQMRYVLRDFVFSHMFGVAFVVKEYKSPDPLKVGLFCANGVVFFADYFADLVEKSHGVPLPLIFASRIAPVTDQNTNRTQELQLEIL